MQEIILYTITIVVFGLSACLYYVFRKRWNDNDGKFIYLLIAWLLVHWLLDWLIDSSLIDIFANCLNCWSGSNYLNLSSSDRTFRWTTRTYNVLASFKAKHLYISRQWTWQLMSVHNYIRSKHVMSMQRHWEHRAYRWLRLIRPIYINIRCQQ